MKMFATGWMTALLILGGAGCSSALEPADRENSSPPVNSEMLMIPTLESITESVLDDAARRTGVERESLKIESAAAVTWADGSLGCPQPGMSYTMALVPGYRIKVEAGEQVLDYHATRRGHFMLCPSGMAREPIVGDSI
jgi:hypothetical protein